MSTNPVTNQVQIAEVPFIQRAANLLASGLSVETIQTDFSSFSVKDLKTVKALARSVAIFAAYAFAAAVFSVVTLGIGATAIYRVITQRKEGQVETTVQEEVRPPVQEEGQVETTGQGTGISIVWTDKEIDEQKKFNQQIEELKRQKAEKENSRK